MDVYVQPVQRIIVKFLVAEGCSGAEIHHCLLAVFKTLWRALQECSSGSVVFVADVNQAAMILGALFLSTLTLFLLDLQ